MPYLESWRPLAIASTQDKIPDDLALATYVCDDCKDHFISNFAADFRPHCIRCGSRNTFVVDKPTDTASIIDPEAYVSNLPCPHCAAHNLLKPLTLSEYGGRIYCLTCGHYPVYKPREQGVDPFEKLANDPALQDNVLYPVLGDPSFYISRKS